MHVILTGATGLIGSGVLHQMLNTEGISRISVLSRRPVAMTQGHEGKAKVILHQDFQKYDAGLLEELRDAQGIVWSLGVSQNTVSKEYVIAEILYKSMLLIIRHREYFEITHEYTMAAAKAFSTLHPDSPFTFVYVSGEGATQTPGAFTTQYGRVKGQVEQSLFDLGKQNPNFKVYSVRPAAVGWKAHHEIHPFIPSLPTLLKLPWHRFGCSLAAANLGADGGLIFSSTVAACSLPVRRRAKHRLSRLSGTPGWLTDVTPADTAAFCIMRRTLSTKHLDPGKTQI